MYARLKQKLYLPYGLFHSLKYPKELLASFFLMFNENVLENKKHIKLASDWLLFMQNSDGGYSRKFSLISGRDSSYIETTGYIVPTLFNVAEFFNDNAYKESAFKAGEWLLSIQNSDGGFSEIDHNQPYAFDTGQVLIGLNRLYKESDDVRYQQAAKDASYWLAEHQELDGSWEKVAYNNQKHTYYSRVSGAMLEYATVNSDEYIREVALKNIGWVLSQQDENGFFNHASFLKEVPAYLHTIVYILEGFLDVYEITQDRKILDAVLANSEVMKSINLTKDMLLCSQYDEAYSCKNSERCITGLAQWAGVALRLYAITKDEDYKKIAITTLFYLKSKQIQEGEKLKGALSASVPFWGRYGSFDFVNWGNKFFIDSLLLLDKYSLTVSEEQELWVGLAFGFNEEVVEERLSLMDRAYLNHFDRVFKKRKDEQLTLVDLGCGRGRFLDYFRANYPKWNIIGIEPTFENGDKILRGSAYAIPLEDDSVDILFTIEVLQHTYLDEAMKEIGRVLKPSSCLVVGERNPLSVLGLLKPVFELKGKWMYPWDSPFKERWYSKSKWLKNFYNHGFTMKSIESINNPYDRKVKFLNRYYFMVGERK